MTNSTPSRDNVKCERDELAQLVADECDSLASKWWRDRDSYLYALENDPFWEEPKLWVDQSRPPTRTCGAVLARILTEYERGEQIPVYDLLQWAHDRHVAQTDQDRTRLAHGYYRASNAIRKGIGLGYPENDPILGGVV